MEKFETHTGVGVPLRRSNVDTDQIIPAEYLKRVTRTGFEDGLFAAWRKDGAFVLNNPRLRQRLGPRGRTGLRDGVEPRARRLGPHELRLPRGHQLALRRHLPRQQRQAGPAHSSRVAGQRRAAVEVPREPPGAEITVDLVARTVTAGEIVAPFEIDDYTRWRLLEGLDDIGLTMRHADEVSRFESSRPSHKPVTIPVDASA